MTVVADGVRDEVVAALSRRPRVLSPRFFYDVLGSRLFDAITQTPEYYPTGCELGILRGSAGAIADALGAGVTLVELGAGQARKVPILLRALRDVAAYLPVDIDADTVEAAASRLRRAFPGLDVRPVAADFTDVSSLPRPGGRVVLFYPGSTVGNLHPDEARRFLAALGARYGVGARLLVGFDLEKDPAVLEAAYDDPVGVTAAFNRNMLAHLNRAVGTDFDVRRYEHVAFWNDARKRVEMHLRAVGAQVVHLDGHTFRIDDGELLHTECSYKYTPARFRELLAAAGWIEEELWTDARAWFGVGLYRVAAPGG